MYQCGLYEGFGCRTSDVGPFWWKTEELQSGSSIRRHRIEEETPVMHIMNKMLVHTRLIF